MATVEAWRNHTCVIYDDPTLVSHVQGLLVRKSKTKPSEAVDVAKAFLNSVSEQLSLFSCWVKTVFVGAFCHGLQNTSNNVKIATS